VFNKARRELQIELQGKPVKMNAISKALPPTTGQLFILDLT
jgi:hypothetical protein